MAPPLPSAPSAAVAAPARGAALRRLCWLLGAAGLSLAFTVQPLRDPDVWWHLALGRLIGAHGIPHDEPFTFLGAPHHWVGQQWGYEVLLAHLADAGGAALMMLALGMIASAALLVAACAVPRRDAVGGGARAAAMVGCGLVAAPVLGVRGQVVSLLGTAVVLLVLARWREGSSRAPWVLPPLLLVWANLHAGFVAGLVLPLLVAATIAMWRCVDASAAPQARLRPLLAATAVAALATLANPAGPELWSYVAQTFANPTLTDGIVEWQSPDFHNAFLRLFEVLAVGLVVLWALSRQADPVDVALGIAALAATLQAQRNVSLFCIVALPQVARYGTLAVRQFGAEHGGRARRRGGAGRALPAGIAAAAAAVVVAGTLAAIAPTLRASATADYEARHDPQAAADYVASHLPGERLYSTYEWGGYLANRFPTQRVVYIYGESAIFGNDRLQQYLDIHLVRASWQQRLQEGGMRHAIVPADSQEATALLEVGWRTLCHDVLSGAVVMRAPADGEPTSAATPPPDPATAPRCAG